MGFGPQMPHPERRRKRPGGGPLNLRPTRMGVRWLLILVLGIAAAIASRWVAPVVKGTIEGRPRIVDGDSFFIGRTEVRMQGIDAPEGRQTCRRGGRAWPCGEEAKTALQRLTAGRAVRCDIHSTDQHGRKLATCFSATGENLNARMVAEGYAVAFGSYRDEEQAARSARRGLWGSEFERPQDWRRRNNAGS